jgi:phosphate-selective porin OprO/OprP
MPGRLESVFAHGGGASAPGLASRICAWVLLGSLILAVGWQAKADTNSNSDSVAALRQLVEQQSRQLEELNEKVRVLEEREEQREAAPADQRLPAIVIDTNGAPLGTLAFADSGSRSVDLPAKPLPMISAGAGGFTFRSADTNFLLTMHGLVQVDSRTFFKDNPLSQGNDGFVLRRARPILEGTLFRDCDFILVPDFGYLSFLLYDANITYHFAPWCQLTAGKFKGPVGLEQLQTDIAAPLNERSLASDFVPLRNLGVQLSGEFGDDLVTWAAGIYDQDGDNRLPANTPFSNDLELGGRLFYQPFIQDPANWLHGLGVGVGGTYSEVSSNSAALPATLGGTLPGYLSTGQQQFFAYNPLLGPVVANGPHSRLSPEAYYYVGPFGAQAEYIFDQQEVRNDFTMRSAWLNDDAWQVTAQWMLTGENASFNAITPAHPFDLRAGHWGAWQLVARYSELDIDKKTFKGFSDPATSAQSAAAWSVGLNWWLNANVRWMVSFSHTTFVGGGGVNYLIPSTTAPPATVSHQDESVLFTRIQIAF